MSGDNSYLDLVEGAIEQDSSTYEKQQWKAIINMDEDFDDVFCVVAEVVRVAPQAQSVPPQFLGCKARFVSVSEDISTEMITGITNSTTLDVMNFVIQAIMIKGEPLAAGVT